MNSYSQNGEDLIVVKILGEEFTGRLLEIGAWKPKEFSNSRLLIERGWEAVLVEFSPSAVRELISEYGKNDKIKILQAAISIDDNSLLPFYISDREFSTSSESLYQKWSEEAGFLGKVWVPQISLDRLLMQFGGGFNFVSFDTEGSSVDLARHFIMQLEQTPEVMCVEHDERFVELMQTMQQYGYCILHTNGTNLILARR